MNAKNLDRIKDFHLPPSNPPSTFPFEVTLAVADVNTDVVLGAMQRVSPEEPCHQAILSVSEAINKKVGDAILHKWRNLLLNVPTNFVIVSVGLNRYWMAINLREEIAENFTTLVRSLKQRIHEIFGFKLDQEKATGGTVSNNTLALQYKKNMKYAKGTEHVTKR